MYKLRTSLKTQLEAISGSAERASLMCEVDVARLTAQRAISLYELACEGEKPDVELEQETRGMVKESLQLVAALLKDQTKLEANISPFDADAFIKKVLVVMNRHLKEFPDQFDKIHQDLHSLDLSQSTSPVQIIIN